MTTHEFARKLLAGPDVAVVVPRVIAYDDSDNPTADPMVAFTSVDHDGVDVDVAVISYSGHDAFCEAMLLHGGHVRLARHVTTTALLTALRSEHERSVKFRNMAIEKKMPERVVFLNGYVAALLFAISTVLSDAQGVPPGYVKEALKT